MRKLTIWTNSGPMDIRPDMVQELAEWKHWQVLFCLYPDCKFIPYKEHTWKQPIMFALAGSQEYILKCLDSLGWGATEGITLIEEGEEE